MNVTTQVSYMVYQASILPNRSKKGGYHHEASRHSRSQCGRGSALLSGVLSGRLLPHQDTCCIFVRILLGLTLLPDLQEETRSLATNAREIPTASSAACRSSSAR